MNFNLNNITYYILIIDDDTDDHFFLKKAISKVIPHAIVKSLYDGEDALEYLENSTELPNLIFLDLNMTRISGNKTMKLIRKNPALNKIPVVILTTSSSESEKQELLNSGANDFYSKPYHTEDLVYIVEEIREKWLDMAHSDKHSEE